MQPGENVQRMAQVYRHSRIAVIGTGISGLSAAWHLRNAADITVYEKNQSIGGHTHTVTVNAGGRSTPVDMGFIVFNESTYPNLTAMFSHLGVKTQTTDMSLAISMDNGRLEYAGGHLSQLFAQKRNLANPRFWSMLRDLTRFYRSAPADLPMLRSNSMTLGEYLEVNNYGPAFREDHLLPMAAAIWSMPTRAVLDYPAYAFIRFHDNHGLLKLTDRPLWRTVTGGSQTYVQALTSALPEHVKTGVSVVSVSREADGVAVKTADGSLKRYDHVVIAAHADQALAMLAQPTMAEQRLLGAFGYNRNRAILHSDNRQMPLRRRAWASWNYLGRSQHVSSTELTVTYWMNRLQRLPENVPLFVTLNPDRQIDDSLIHQIETFEHPIFNSNALDAQQELWSLQGQGGIWYCGSYFGAGFHEDGLQSGLAVAEAISRNRRPWQVENESGRIIIGASPSNKRMERTVG